MAVTVLSSDQHWFEALGRNKEVDSCASRGLEFPASRSSLIQGVLPALIRARVADCGWRRIAIQENDKDRSRRPPSRAPFGYRGGLRVSIFDSSGLRRPVRRPTRRNEA